uniref:Uncharacterized protein n=1 Tax=Meloidogyne incognita TaxID=6306 RepID=A0A914MKC2_MELIC
MLSIASSKRRIHWGYYRKGLCNNIFMGNVVNVVGTYWLLGTCIFDFGWQETA